MPKFITAVGAKFPAHSGDMAQMLFGNRKAKVPTEGLPPREVQGIKVWAIPLTPGRFRLRLMCECPACHRVMPVGRLAQHSKVHSD